MKLPFTDERGNVLLDILDVPEAEATQHAPLPLALMVARHEGRYLLVFNTWKKRWELPGGLIEAGETPREAAQRELAEEANQTVSDPHWVGLAKFDLAPDRDHADRRIEYGAIFGGEIASLQPFAENEESEGVRLWQSAETLEDLQAIDALMIVHADAHWPRG